MKWDQYDPKAIIYLEYIIMMIELEVLQYRQQKNKKGKRKLVWQVKIWCRLGQQLTFFHILRYVWKWKGMVKPIAQTRFGRETMNNTRFRHTKKLAISFLHDIMSMQINGYRQKLAMRIGIWSSFPENVYYMAFREEDQLVSIVRSRVQVQERHQLLWNRIDSW